MGRQWRIALVVLLFAWLARMTLASDPELKLPAAKRPAALPEKPSRAPSMKRVRRPGLRPEPEEDEFKGGPEPAPARSTPPAASPRPAPAAATPVTAAPAPTFPAASAAATAPTGAAPPSPARGLRERPSVSDLIILRATTGRIVAPVATPARLDLRGRWRYTTPSAPGRLTILEHTSDGVIRGYYGARTKGEVHGRLNGDQLDLTFSTRLILTFRGRMHGKLVTDADGRTTIRGTMSAAIGAGPFNAERE